MPVATKAATLVRRASTLGLTGALLLSGCGGSTSASREENTSRRGFDKVAAALDRTLDKSFEDAGVPAIAAAVIVSERGQWASARGMADVQHGRRATTTTPFAQGSITKLMVATLAVRLAEQGRLRLDDRLSRLIENPPPGAGSIPLRRLLNQTSGIGDRPETYEAVARQPRRRWTMDEILGRVDVFQPPGEFVYMDANYQLAGKAIERATRTTVGSALRRELLDPLGLDDIVLQPEQRPSPLAAHGYDRRGRDLSDGSGYTPYTSWASAAWTAGGLVASPQSLARFGDALFSGRALKPESLRTMVRFGDADYWEGYGLGVARTEVRGREVWGHGGRIPGFASELWHLPREHITLAVVVNDEDWVVEETAAELLDAVLESAAQ